MSLNKLSQSPLFSGVDESTLTTLVQNSKEISAKKGEVIVKVGSPPMGYYCISGTASEWAISQKREGQFDVHDEGSLFGGFHVRVGIPFTTEVRADSDWRGLEIPRETLLSLFSSQDELQRRLEQNATTHAQKCYLAQRLLKVFKTYPRETFEDFHSKAEWSFIERGQVLDLKDQDYTLVHGGLVEVGDNGQSLREILPGQMISQTAVAEETHMILAGRNSEVLGLSRENHFSLLSKYPEYLKAFFRLIENPERREGLGESVIARTIALIPAHDREEVRAFADAMEEAVKKLGSILVLDSQRAREMTGEKDLSSLDSFSKRRLSWWLNSQEEKYRFVLYVTDPEPTDWTQLCLHNADRAITVSDAKKSPEITTIERKLLENFPKERKSLILLHNKNTEQPQGTREWLAPRDVRHHFHFRVGLKKDAERLARFLTGRAVAVVLSGGAAKGFAHIGVLKAFNDLNIPVDIVGGTSAGSSVGAAYAVGWDHEKLLNDVPLVFRKCFSLSSMTLPFQSLLNTSNYDRMVWKYVPNIDIEDLWIPFFSISSRLKNAQPHLFKTGPLPLAVAGSGRVPGLLSPLELDGDYLVDGGLLDNLPVLSVREISRYASIIAIDVSSGPFEEKEKSMGWLRRRFQSVPDPSLTLGSVLRRITAIGTIRQISTMIEQSGTQLYITPPVRSIPAGNFTTENARNAAQVGYDHAKPILEKWWSARSMS